MRTYTSTTFKRSTALLVTLLIAACGGSDDDDANKNFNPAVTYKLAGTGTPNSVNGKGLYASACAGCHGAAFPNAKDSTRTLAAIAANLGGMGALAASIKTQQSDDIAAYLAGI